MKTTMHERNTLWAFLYGNFLIGTGVMSVASAHELPHDLLQATSRPAKLIDIAPENNTNA